MDQNEQIIANFLKRPDEGGAYTDEKLAALLAPAEDGKLSYVSCCCLIGVPTAGHALRGVVPHVAGEPHLVRAQLHPCASEVERAYRDLASKAGTLETRDAQRRARTVGRQCQGCRRVRANGSRSSAVVGAVTVTQSRGAITSELTSKKKAPSTGVAEEALLAPDYVGFRPRQSPLQSGRNTTIQNQTRSCAAL